MKWELIEPKKGDIIRVKTGSIYHYGIYASDDEIIQFGLNPVSRVGVADADISVCSSCIDDFLVGGFLEVGTAEKKDKKRFSPDKTVKLARERLGEKGYHILNNNCEHFANECYCGEKFSSQTDGVRALFRNLPLIDVYIAPIPSDCHFTKLYPSKRQAEIDAVSNYEVKKEKYFVWKLLQYGLERSFGKKFAEFKFKKSSSGKWICDKCEFSLSHSHGAVCVAVSKTPVGVDIEKIELPKMDISKEILSVDELEKYSSIGDDEKVEFVIRAWTKKESLFKKRNEKSISREDFRSLNDTVFEKIVCVGENKYSLSVATDHIAKVKVYENIELI